MTEREQFEKWITSPPIGQICDRYIDSEPLQGRYKRYEVHLAWETWQAARATPALPQPEHDLQDVRCQCCGYMTYHSEHMGCIRAAYRQALPQGMEEWIAKCERFATIENNVLAFNMANDLRAYLSGMAIVPVDSIPAALPIEPFQTIDRGGKNYKAGWNACRLAMLDAAKEKQS